MLDVYTRAYRHMCYWLQKNGSMVHWTSRYRRSDLLDPQIVEFSFKRKFNVKCCYKTKQKSYEDFVDLCKPTGAKIHFSLHILWNNYYIHYSHTIRR